MQAPYNDAWPFSFAVAWFTFDPSNVLSTSDFVFSNSNFTITTCLNEDRVILGGVGLSRGVHYWEFTVDRCDASAQPAFGVARYDCAKDGMLGKKRRCQGLTMFYRCAKRAPRLKLVAVRFRPAHKPTLSHASCVREASAVDHTKVAFEDSPVCASLRTWLEWGVLIFIATFIEGWAA